MIPDTITPPVPPYHHSARDTLEEGVCMGGGGGLLQMRGQTPRLQHPCPAHTHDCLQVFVGVCVTCLLACDTRSESLRLAVLVVTAKWCIQSVIDRVCFFNGYYAQVYVFCFSSLKCHLTFLEVKRDHIWMSMQSATQPANAHLSLSSWMGY